MGRGSRFLESSATEEEDSYEYRVEWDDYITVKYDLDEQRVKTKHYGPGSRDISGFDNAWNNFNDCRDDPDYVRVRLIKIDPNGSENVYASS